MSKKNKVKDTNVQDVLDLFFDERNIFTKYDITKQLRHEGFIVKHGKVRKILKSILQLPVDYYADNLQDLGYAEVYIPNEKDISDYDQDYIPEFDVNAIIDNDEEWTEEDAINALTKSPASNIILRCSKCKPSNSLFDKRGRYCVKAQQTRDAGFDISDGVYVSVHSGKIVLTDKPQPHSIPVSIDCYFNIRLPKRYFVSAFGKVPLDINTKIKNMKIIIEEKN